MESKCEIDSNGNKLWRNSDGKYHRENGPAIECKNGTKKWIIMNRYHREDGPAVIWRDTGEEEWYINNVKYSYDYIDNKQYKTADNMPLNLFLAYCRWEYKKNGK